MSTIRQCAVCSKELGSRNKGLWCNACGTRAELPCSTAGCTGLINRRNKQGHCTSCVWRFRRQNPEGREYNRLAMRRSRERQTPEEVEADRERARLAMKAHYTDPRVKETKRDYEREYVQRPEVKARRKSRMLAWQRANPERTRKYNDERRALKLGAEGTHTLTEREAVFAQCAFACVECGSTERSELDHCIPLDMEGNPGAYDQAWNLQVLCKTCNVTKGSRFISSWRPCLDADAIG